MFFEKLCQLLMLFVPITTITAGYYNNSALLLRVKNSVKATVLKRQYTLNIEELTSVHKKQSKTWIYKKLLHLILYY